MHITQCSKCRRQVINDHLCEWCKKGYTREEADKIILEKNKKESLKSLKNILKVQKIPKSLKNIYYEHSI